MDFVVGYDLSKFKKYYRTLEDLGAFHKKHGLAETERIELQDSTTMPRSVPTVDSGIRHIRVFSETEDKASKVSSASNSKAALCRI